MNLSIKSYIGDSEPEIMDIPGPNGTQYDQAFLSMIKHDLCSEMLDMLTAYSNDDTAIGSKDWIDKITSYATVLKKNLEAKACEIAEQDAVTDFADRTALVDVHFPGVRETYRHLSIWD